jgi:hypothetical protein
MGGETMTALRMQFFTLAVIFFLGIWLTGFEKAHWFLYVPVVALVFAGATGICPGLIIWKKLGFK